MRCGCIVLRVRRGKTRKLEGREADANRGVGVTLENELRVRGGGCWME